jgi:hypothetical protein
MTAIAASAWPDDEQPRERARRRRRSRPTRTIAAATSIGTFATGMERRPSAGARYADRDLAKWVADVVSGNLAQGATARAFTASAGVERSI